jgi:hypothetical protein
MVPLPPVVRVFADFAGAEISLNREPLGQLDGGRYVLDDLRPGEHSMTIWRPGVGQATVRIKVVPGQRPVVVGGPTANQLQAIAVTSYRRTARILASFGTAKVRLDGNEVGELDAGVLELNSLPPGRHEIAFVDGSRVEKLRLQIGAEPSVFFVAALGKLEGAPTLTPAAPQPRPVTAEPAVDVASDIIEKPEDVVPRRQERSVVDKPRPQLRKPAAKEKTEAAGVQPAAEPAPQVDLAVSPNFIRIGDQLPSGVIVRWAATGATQVTVEPRDKFQQALKGHCRFYPAKSLTIRVTAEGAGGKVTKEARVEVDDRFFQMPPSFANQRCEPVAR